MVVTNNWDVLCFDHNLRLRWSHKIKVKTSAQQPLAESPKYLNSNDPMHSWMGTAPVFGDELCE